MSAFRDLDEFFDDTLSLPIRGKTYVIQPVDAKTGLNMQRMMTIATSAASGIEVTPEQVAAVELDDEGEEQLYRLALGATYDELVADGVNWPRIKHTGLTAYFFQTAGRELAEKVWASGGPGKARKQPQDRKPRAKK